MISKQANKRAYFISSQSIVEQIIIMVDINRKQTMISCNICNKSFTQNGSMKRHFRTYHLDSYSCNFCQQSFGTNNELKQHIKCEHEERYNTITNQKAVSCSICHKSFSQESSRNRHIQIVHEKAKPHSCYICKESFSTKDNLKKHVIRIHPLNRINLYSCNFCDLEFSDFKAMIDHKISHTNYIKHRGVTIQCNFCSKHFICKQKLKLHKEKVHKKAYSCGVCCKLFRSRTKMKEHKKVHQDIFESTVIVEKGEYYCDKCQTTLKNKQNFDLHVLRNHKKDMSSYSCELCKHLCEDNGQLKKHTLTHFRSKVEVNVFNVFDIKQTCLDYNDKEFILSYCEFCFQTFTNNDILMKHKQSHVRKTAEIKLKKQNAIGPIPNRFTCKLCGDKFGLMINFLKHKMMHLLAFRNVEENIKEPVTVSKEDDYRKERMGCPNVKISSKTKLKGIHNINAKRNAGSKIDTFSHIDADEMKEELINCDIEGLIDDCATLVDEGVHDLDDSRSLD